MESVYFSFANLSPIIKLQGKIIFALYVLGFFCLFNGFSIFTNTTNIFIAFFSFLLSFFLSPKKRQQTTVNNRRCLLFILGFLFYVFFLDIVVSSFSNFFSYFAKFVLIIGISLLSSTYKQTPKALFYACSLQMILQLVLLIFLNSSCFLDDNFIGSFSTKNNAAGFFTFSIIVGIGYAKTINTIFKRPSILLYLCLAAFLLFRTNCASSVFWLLIPLFIALVFYKKRISLFVLLCFIFLVFFYYLFIGNNAIDLLFSSLGKNSDFTGRREIWKILLSYISDTKTLYFGNGFYELWSNDGFLSQISCYYSNIFFGLPIGSHNVFLELLLQTGLFGLVYFLFILFLGFKSKVKIWQDTLLSVLLILLFGVYSLDERGFGSFSWISFSFFYPLFMLNSTAIYQKEKKE